MTKLSGMLSCLAVWHSVTAVVASTKLLYTMAGSYGTGDRVVVSEIYLRYLGRPSVGRHSEYWSSCHHR